jgi:hypothetical protein
MNVNLPDNRTRGMEAEKCLVKAFERVGWDIHSAVRVYTDHPTPPLMHPSRAPDKHRPRYQDGHRPRRRRSYKGGPPRYPPWTHQRRSLLTGCVIGSHVRPRALPEARRGLRLPRFLRAEYRGVGGRGVEEVPQDLGACVLRCTPSSRIRYTHGTNI